MAQQINLYVKALHMPRRVATAAQALLLAGVVAGGAAFAAALLQWQAMRTAQEVAALQQQATRMQAQLAATAASAPTGSASSLEIERLRLRVAAQRRVAQALSGGVPIAPQPSDYLLALARQANASVWLTGFSLAADERAVEIRGRMFDAAALPAYLQRLQAEPRFKGRSFAQLEIRPPATPADAAAPYAEFVLRSAAPAASAAQETPR